VPSGKKGGNLKRNYIATNWLRRMKGAEPEAGGKAKISIQVEIFSI
jgi:hypothetical protein